MISEQKAMTAKVIDQLNSSRVVSVIVIDEVTDAVPLARALVRGGVDIIELTLRTPVAMEAAKVIINEVPEITVGLGTVLTEGQVKSAKEAGVAFAVSPGCNPRIIKAAQDHGLSFSPGIATPTDIELAIELGCRILKYFPAATSGGIKHLQSMAAPYQFLDVKFIPLGGVNIDNAVTYLSSPLISAIGGSWIAKRDLIKNKQWDSITANAMAVRELIDKISQVL